VSKSILEKALLEAEQLEDTMKSNAKEILSSIMKEEIHELVKESLSENDYLKEQEEEEEVDVLDIEDDIMGDEPEMDLTIDDDMELDMEDETEDDITMELPPLDLTLASDAEVLTVFKAMGDEDGIIIQQDDDEIELTDNTTDAEYIIKLGEQKKLNKMKKSIKENEYMDEMDNMDEMDELEVTDEEVVYEIELSDDGTDDEEGEVTEGGAKKGDQSATHRDYMKEGGAKKGDQSATHRDYMKEGGAKKGDQSATHLDYEEVKEGGAKKGDQSATHLDYEEVKEGGAKKGDQSATHRDYEMKEASRTLGLGRESGGKHKPSGIRKAISNNRNLGESRIRKSYNLLKEEVDTLKVKNSDYRKALVTFRDKLNEVGVFNSNLAYVTRLFTEHSTTKQEKINILKRFDTIDSLKSSKGLYKVIKEELSQDVAKPTKTISESVTNKITKSPTSGGKLLESKVYENPQFSRMKDLMSKL
tara:strand:- start:1186 stop:2607 length:1422 start_codon:yes stop_codon:yes gene_type:complete